MSSTYPRVPETDWDYYFYLLLLAIFGFLALVFLLYCACRCCNWLILRDVKDCEDCENGRPHTHKRYARYKRQEDSPTVPLNNHYTPPPVAPYNFNANPPKIPIKRTQQWVNSISDGVVYGPSDTHVMNHATKSGPFRSLNKMVANDGFCEVILQAANIPSNDSGREFHEAADSNDRKEDYGDAVADMEPEEEANTFLEQIERLEEEIEYENPKKNSGKGDAIEFLLNLKK